MGISCNGLRSVAALGDVQATFKIQHSRPLYDTSINDHYTTKNITRPKQLKPLLIYINVLFFPTPHSIII